MGCGPAQPEQPAGNRGSQLHIYGDYFNTESRALLVICEMANIDKDFHLISLLEQANESAEYLSKNPTGSIPMLQRGEGQPMITSGWEVFEYLIRIYPEQIHEAFEAPSNKQKTMRNYFYHDFRAKSSKLIRRAANLKLSPQRSEQNPEDPKLLREIGALDQIYAELNETLSKSEFFTSSRVSVIDVLYFCEIYQLTKHYREIPSHLNKLADWFDEMLKIEAVK